MRAAVHVMWSVVAVAGSAGPGCSLLVSSSSDAGSAADPGDAAGPDGAAGTQPFGGPAVVTELSHPDFSDDDPTLRMDLLEIYFCSTRAGTGNEDIYRSTRDNPGESWSTPELVTALSDPDSNDTNVELSADGLKIYWVRKSDGGDAVKLLAATRTTLGPSWSAPIENPEFETVMPLGATPAGPSTLYLFQSDPAPPQPPPDIFVSVRDGGGTFGAPVAVDELNTAFAEESPWATADQTAVAITSNRLGTFDLFLARRARAADPLEPPQPIEELNSEFIDETDPWLTDDLREIYFTRGVPGDRATRDIVRAARF